MATPLKQRSGDASPPLIAAVKAGDAVKTEALVKSGVDVNAVDASGMTALHHAAARGARGCIRVLVANGTCDYLVRDGQGRYASELAIEGARDYGVARLLRIKQVQQAHLLNVPPYVRPERNRENRAKDRGR